MEVALEPRAYGVVPAPSVAQMGVLEQRSPTFLAPGTVFVDDSFSTDGSGGWFKDNSCAQYT